MTLSRTLIFLAVASIIFLSSRSAKADTITFDDTVGVIASDRYKSQGVLIFTSGDPYYRHTNPIIVSDSRSTSPPNILRNQSCFGPGLNDPCYATISIKFVLPGTETPGVTDTFSFDIVGGGPGVDNSGNPFHYVIRALDVNNEYLFINSYVSDGLTHHFEFSAPSNIFTVLFDPSLSLEGIDNFSFGKIITSPPKAVPEPASLFLLSTGLAGITYRAWRRKLKS